MSSREKGSWHLMSSNLLCSPRTTRQFCSRLRLSNRQVRKPRVCYRRRRCSSSPQTNNTADDNCHHHHQHHSHGVELHPSTLPQDWWVDWMIAPFCLRIVRCVELHGFFRVDSPEAMTSAKRSGERGNLEKYWIHWLLTRDESYSTGGELRTPSSRA